MLVPNAWLVQPFSSVTGVKSLIGYDTPSSEVKHWALLNEFSAMTVTAPLGWMNSRPLVPPHRSTGTNTLVDGRNAAGRVNARPVEPVEMAPFRCAMPLISSTPGAPLPKPAVAQPFCRVSALNVLGSWANH